ncbi:MAG: flagellar hook protein FlgE [Pyrinomonadaceae bacterium]
MAFAFNTALSGLNANSTALNIVGNNIANANTIGFRGSSITFMDVYAGSGGARLNGAGNNLQVGNGVQTGAIHTNFDQGNLVESGSPLHSAIQGNGFFVVRNPSGFNAYTRAGDFTVSRTGDLLSSNGGEVQGYMATNGVIVPGTVLSTIRFPIGQTIQPQVTSEATFRMNLNASANTGAIFHATMQVFDSRGTERTLDLTFTRLADGTFDMTGTLDGVAVETIVDGGAQSPNPVNFVFNTDGTLGSPTSLQIIPDQTQLGTAVLPSIDIKLRETNPDGTPGSFNITSYTGNSAVGSTSQDGYAAGELNGAAVDQDGFIFGIFSNGQSRVIGRFALATFNSNESLQRLGGNMFAETLTSGQATIGEPGSGGRGLLAGGYLEQSNVNITDEFVDLIQAQRGFQANSRVITTLNQTFQDLLQIV